MKYVYNKKPMHNTYKIWLSNLAYFLSKYFKINKATHY